MLAGPRWGPRRGLTLTTLAPCLDRPGRPPCGAAVHGCGGRTRSLPFRNPRRSDARRHAEPRRMKITDLKCAILGKNPIIRIVTDEGIDGYGEIEVQAVPHAARAVLRRRCSAKTRPTSSGSCSRSASAAASSRGAAPSAPSRWRSGTSPARRPACPVYKLLGGKVRDRVRIYNGGLRFPMRAYTPEEYAESTRKMIGAPEGFTIVKQPHRVPQPDEARASRTSSTARSARRACQASAGSRRPDRARPQAPDRLRRGDEGGHSATRSGWRSTAAPASLPATPSASPGRWSRTT